VGRAWYLRASLRDDARRSAPHKTTPANRLPSTNRGPYWPVPTTNGPRRARCVFSSIDWVKTTTDSCCSHASVHQTALQPGYIKGYSPRPAKPGAAVHPRRSVVVAAMARLATAETRMKIFSGQKQKKKKKC